MSEEQSAAPSEDSAETVEPVSMFELGGMTAVRDDEPKETSDEEVVEEETDESDSEAGDSSAEESDESSKADGQGAKKKEASPDDAEIIDLGEGIKESKKQIREILKSDKSIRARFGEVGQKEEAARKLIAEAETKSRKTNEDLAIIAEHMGNLDKDPVAGLITVLDAFGADGRGVIRSVRKALEAEVLERLNLTEAEKEALEAREELEATKAKLTTREEKEKAAKTQEQFRQQILATASNYGLSPQDYQEAFQQVNTLYSQGHFQNLKNAGPDKAAMTVIEHGFTMKTIERIDTILNGIDETLKSDDTLMRELVQIVKSGIDCSDDDIADIARALAVETKGTPVATKAQPAKKSSVEVVEEEDENGEVVPLGYGDLL